MIYTDALQTAIMLVGALTLMGYSKWRPLRGGWWRLSDRDTCVCSGPVTPAVTSREALRVPPETLLHVPRAVPSSGSHETQEQGARPRPLPRLWASWGRVLHSEESDLTSVGSVPGSIPLPSCQLFAPFFSSYSLFWGSQCPCPPAFRGRRSEVAAWGRALKWSLSSTAHAQPQPQAVVSQEVKQDL